MTNEKYDDYKSNKIAEQWIFYDLLEYCSNRLNIDSSELLKDFNEHMEKEEAST